MMLVWNGRWIWKKVCYFCLSVLNLKAFLGFELRNHRSSIRNDLIPLCHGQTVREVYVRETVRITPVKIYDTSGQINDELGGTCGQLPNSWPRALERAKGGSISQSLMRFFNILEPNSLPSAFRALSGARCVRRTVARRTRPNSS